jgi:hypothetical protein
VDKDFVCNLQTSINIDEQITGGGAVKITDQVEVNAVTVPMSENFEIFCHDFYSFCAILFGRDYFFGLYRIFLLENGVSVKILFCQYLNVCRNNQKS